MNVRDKYKTLSARGDVLATGANNSKTLLYCTQNLHFLLFVFASTSYFPCGFLIGGFLWEQDPEFHNSQF